MKKKCGQWLAVMLSLVMIAQLAACSAEVKVPSYEDDRQITIGAWVGPPPGFITSERFQEVAESGINLIYALYEDLDQNALDALKYAEENDIGYLARSRAIRSIPDDELELMDGLLDDFTDSPALKGVLVYDEPGAGQFDRLRVLNEKFKELYPDLMFYVNLFPTYSSLDQRDGRTYKAYIDEYIEKVKTDYISYDHYPLMQASQGSYVKEDYLYNLEVVSNAAKKADIPFWVFIQSMGFWVAGAQNRVPDESDIRWQVYNSLAFGAKAIQHFTYWTPLQDDVTVFSEAMITKDGERTPIYDAVKNVNHEILNFDHIYLNFDHVGVMTFPENNAPPELYIENRLEQFAPVKSVDSEHPIVIGCFEDKDGNQAIIVVNYTDPAADLTNDVTIKLDKVKEMIAHDSSGSTHSKLKGGKLELTLQPGEGKFIQLLK